MSTGSRFVSSGWRTVAATFLCLAGCSKPQPNAPTKDFAQRYHCPVGRVESMKEGSDRMRVTGCGESEMYVRSCERGGVALPPREARQPVTEGEARMGSPPQPAFTEPGCAWAREKPTVAPAGSAPQPKWLSTP